jgi:hypothetical protein
MQGWIAQLDQAFEFSSFCGWTQSIRLAMSPINRVNSSNPRYAFLGVYTSLLAILAISSPGKGTRLTGAVIFRHVQYCFMSPLLTSTGSHRMEKCPISSQFTLVHAMRLGA